MIVIHFKVQVQPETRDELRAALAAVVAGARATPGVVSFDIGEDLTDPVQQRLLKIVGDNFGAAEDELIQATSRAFGFSATSAQLRGVLDDRIKWLLEADQLRSKDGLLIHPD